VGLPSHSRNKIQLIRDSTAILHPHHALFLTADYCESRDGILKYLGPSQLVFFNSKSGPGFAETASMESGFQFSLALFPIWAGSQAGSGTQGTPDAQ
jgi:hypothetical protein